MLTYIAEYIDKTPRGKFFGTYKFEAKNDADAETKMQAMVDSFKDVADLKRVVKKIYCVRKVWEGYYPPKS